MNEKYLIATLEAFKQGELEMNQVVERLKHLPYADLQFARVDHHRTVRQGFPEVIFGPGKTSQQIVGIVRELVSVQSNVLITRVNETVYQAVRDIARDAVYHDAARAVTILRAPLPSKNGVIAIVTAGTADIPVAEEAAVTAQLLGNPIDRFYDVGVAGLHRLLSVREKIIRATAVICIAGMEGALPSVVGGLVSIPVIAVPTSVGYGCHFGGVTALLAMLNSCSPNVAVVNIDNGFGAGVVASMINR